MPYKCSSWEQRDLKQRAAQGEESPCSAGGTKPPCRGWERSLWAGAAAVGLCRELLEMAEAECGIVGGGAQEITANVKPSVVKCVCFPTSVFVGECLVCCLEKRSPVSQPVLCSAPAALPGSGFPAPQQGVGVSPRMPEICVGAHSMCRIWERSKTSTGTSCCTSGAVFDLETELMAHFFLSAWAES